MYIPLINEMPEKSEIIDFIKQYSFATIINISKEKPLATHLPFIVNDSGGKLTLISHFAKANDQWLCLKDGTSLVIFSEPHAYISPSNYEKNLNVPTWNYIAVHIYGKAKIIDDSFAVRQILEKTILNYEPGYLKQWNDLPEEYKAAMEKGIVAFEIEVEEVQAKKKLSQNKTEVERRNIINHLNNSKLSTEKTIAHYMEKDF